MATQNNMSSKDMQTKGRLGLLLLVIFFAAPLFIVVYLHQSNWHPKGHSYGDLVSPLVALKLPPSFQKNTQDKMAQTDVLWHDKWSVVVIASDCAKACETQLHNVRQIHASLEKDMGRLQRILLTHKQDISALQQKYPDLIILNHPEDEVDALAKQFDINGLAALASERIYLVDPLGNLMMSYQTKVTPVEMRKDWVRLLKYSWAG